MKCFFDAQKYNGKSDSEVPDSASRFVVDAQPMFFDFVLLKPEARRNKNIESQSKTRPLQGNVVFWVNNIFV